MFQKLLEKIARGLKALSIDYMVIGGQALLVYGEPRFTQDIDVTLGVGIDRIKDIEKLVKRLSWKSLVDSSTTFIRQTLVFPCLDPKSGIRIDFIFSFSPYERQAIQRVQRIQIGKTEVCFASVEDLIIHKVVAGRPRDLEDIQNVLTRVKRIDKTYVRKWLKEFEESLSQPLLKRFKQIDA